MDLLHALIAYRRGKTSLLNADLFHQDQRLRDPQRDFGVPQQEIRTSLLTSDLSRVGPRLGGSRIQGVTLGMGAQNCCTPNREQLGAYGELRQDELHLRSAPGFMNSGLAPLKHH